jgi:hypothetical protein
MKDARESEAVAASRRSVERGRLKMQQWRDDRRYHCRREESTTLPTISTPRVYSQRISPQLLDMDYFIAFVILAVTCGILQYYVRFHLGGSESSSTASSSTPAQEPAFISFQRNYLMVYYLVMGTHTLLSTHIHSLVVHLLCFFFFSRILPFKDQN